MDARVVEDLLKTNLNDTMDPLEFFPQNPHSLLSTCQAPCEADFQKILDALTRNGVYWDKKWRFNQVNVVDIVGGCLVQRGE